MQSLRLHLQVITWLWVAFFFRLEFFKVSVGKLHPFSGLDVTTSTSWLSWVWTSATFLSELFSLCSVSPSDFYCFFVCSCCIISCTISVVVFGCIFFGTPTNCSSFFYDSWVLPWTFVYSNCLVCFTSVRPLSAVLLASAYAVNLLLTSILWRLCLWICLSEKLVVHNQTSYRTLKNGSFCLTLAVISLSCAVSIHSARFLA